MGNVSTDDILKLAQLSRIALTEDEIKEFTDEISEILSYVEQLQAIDVEGLPPTNQVTGLTNAMRDDVIKSYGYEPAELLKNVPAVENDQIKVKRMVG